MLEGYFANMVYGTGERFLEFCGENIEQISQQWKSWAYNENWLMEWHGWH